jgi:hypothetical protein
LSAGITEAVLVVTPMDVIKIRLQAQKHSMTDPMDIPKYRNALHCAYEIIKAEGFGALYKGVALTALRQCKLCFLVHTFPSQNDADTFSRTPIDQPRTKLSISQFIKK